MMNLHNIVSSVINAVNEPQEIKITPRQDYTVNEYGEAVSGFKTAYTVIADVQPVMSEDIKNINNYNESSIYKAFWVDGEVNGLNRIEVKGGDKIEWNGRTFFVTSVPEGWNDTCGWTHFIAVEKLGK